MTDTTALNDADSGNNSRDVTGFALLSVTVLCAALTVFHLATGAFGALPNLMQRAPHVGMALGICFLTTSSFRSPKGNPSVLDWLCAIAGMVSCFYIVFAYDRITSLDFVPQGSDFVMGAILTLLIVEGGRRVVGWSFPALTVLVLLYAYFGPYFPGRWGHRGFSAELILETLYVTNRGIWGSITGISATVIAMFVIFGSVLMRSGGGGTFMDLSILASGRSTGGAAKVATVASSLFGSVSGSAAANVASTGVFTIPLMKRLNYRPDFAAAVESVASTGGQLAPPIMGAGVFVMAELLNMPYMSIVGAALIPAVLYYVGAFAAIHFESNRVGYGRVPDADIPRPADVFTLPRLASIAVPLGILIVLLLEDFTPATCAFWAIVSSLGLYAFEHRHPSRWRELGSGLLCMAISSGRALVAVVVLIACAQIILSLVAITGLGVKFSSLIIGAGASNVFLSLFLAMIVAMLLGMGLPTTAAYLLAAAVVAPALGRLGIEPLAAHLFVFYYAILAGLTPPICGTVLVASSMAGANWLRTALVAIKLALPAFLVPFLFALDTRLLLKGETPLVVLATATALLGVVSLASAVMGHFRFALPFWARIVIGGGALLLIVPGYQSDIAGIGLAGAMMALNALGRAGFVRRPSGA